jgi:hypothetical protein
LRAEPVGGRSMIATRFSSEKSAMNTPPSESTDRPCRATASAWWATADSSARASPHPPPRTRPAPEPP